MFDPVLFKYFLPQHENRFSAQSFIKNEIATRLMDKLSFIKLRPENVYIDGFATTQIDAIKTLYPEAQVSEELSVHKTYDMIISHCKIQQVPNLSAHLGSWYQRLKPKGAIVFSGFGSSSLQEIKKAWQLIDSMVHVNQMLDMQDVGDLLTQEQYQSVVMDTEILTLEYESLKVLLEDVREMNEPLADTKMRKTLTGKNRWQSFCDRLAKKGLSVSYEVFYGYGYKGDKYLARKGNNAEAAISFDQLHYALKNRG